MALKVLGSLKIGVFKKFWTLYAYTDNCSMKNENSKERNQFHQFIILTNDISSKIIKIKNEFVFVSKSGIETNEPTISAANVGKNNYIIQITKKKIILLQDSNINFNFVVKTKLRKFLPCLFNLMQ